MRHGRSHAQEEETRRATLAAAVAAAAGEGGWVGRRPLPRQRLLLLLAWLVDVDQTRPYAMEMRPRYNLVLALAPLAAAALVREDRGGEGGGHHHLVLRVWVVV